MSSWGRDGEEVATCPCSPAGAPHRAPSLAGRRELAQEAWQQDGRWEALAHPALPGQSTGHKITMAASGLLSGMGPATDESLSHPCRYFHCGCPSTQPRQETRASAVSIQDSRPSAGFVSWLCSHGVSHPLAHLVARWSSMSAPYLPSFGGWGASLLCLSWVSAHPTHHWGLPGPGLHPVGDINFT